jgi:hypothetical protein
MKPSRRRLPGLLFCTAQWTLRPHPEWFISAGRCRTLPSQTRHISQSILRKFRGHIVAVTFAYARCPNPNYCFRLFNNLSQLRRRFAGRVGAGLVLMTFMIDPANDRGKARAVRGDLEGRSGNMALPDRPTAQVEKWRSCSE